MPKSKLYEKAIEAADQALAALATDKENTEPQEQKTLKQQLLFIEQLASNAWNGNVPELLDLLRTNEEPQLVNQPNARGKFTPDVHSSPLHLLHLLLSIFHLLHPHLLHLFLILLLLSSSSLVLFFLLTCSLGQTALYCAARQGHTDVVKHLLEMCRDYINPNVQVVEHGGTPLHGMSTQVTCLFWCL